MLKTFLVLKKVKFLQDFLIRNVTKNIFHQYKCHFNINLTSLLNKSITKSYWAQPNLRESEKKWEQLQDAPDYSH